MTAVKTYYENVMIWHNLEKDEYLRLVKRVYFYMRNPNTTNWQGRYDSIIDVWKNYNVAYLPGCSWYIAYSDRPSYIKIEDARHKDNMSDQAFQFLESLNGNLGISHSALHNNIDDLSEFHSWMKRLDEVKGARPTFWC